MQGTQGRAYAASTAADDVDVERRRAAAREYMRRKRLERANETRERARLEAERAEQTRRALADITRRRRGDMEGQMMMRQQQRRERGVAPSSSLRMERLRRQRSLGGGGIIHGGMDDEVSPHARTKSRSRGGRRNPTIAVPSRSSGGKLKDSGGIPMLSESATYPRGEDGGSPRRDTSHHCTISDDVGLKGGDVPAACAVPVRPAVNVEKNDSDCDEGSENRGGGDGTSVAVHPSPRRSSTPTDDGSLGSHSGLPSMLGNEGVEPARSHQRSPSRNMVDRRRRRGSGIDPGMRRILEGGVWVTTKDDNTRPDAVAIDEDVPPRERQHSGDDDVTMMSLALSPPDKEEEEAGGEEEEEVAAANVGRSPEGSPPAQLRDGNVRRRRAVSSMRDREEEWAMAPVRSVLRRGLAGPPHGCGPHDDRGDVNVAPPPPPSTTCSLQKRHHLAKSNDTRRFDRPNGAWRSTSTTTASSRVGTRRDGGGGGGRGRRLLGVVDLIAMERFRIHKEEEERRRRRGKESGEVADATAVTPSRDDDASEEEEQSKSSSFRVEVPPAVGTSPLVTSSATQCPERGSTLPSRPTSDSEPYLSAVQVNDGDDDASVAEGDVFPTPAGDVGADSDDRVTDVPNGPSPSPTELASPAPTKPGTGGVGSQRSASVTETSTEGGVTRRDRRRTEDDDDNNGTGEGAAAPSPSPSPESRGRGGGARMHHRRRRGRRSSPSRSALADVLAEMTLGDLLLSDRIISRLDGAQRRRRRRQRHHRGRSLPEGMQQPGRPGGPHGWSDADGESSYGELMRRHGEEEGSHGTIAARKSDASSGVGDVGCPDTEQDADGHLDSSVPRAQSPTDDHDALGATHPSVEGAVGEPSGDTGSSSKDVTHHSFGPAGHDGCSHGLGKNAIASSRSGSLDRFSGTSTNGGSYHSLFGTESSIATKCSAVGTTSIRSDDHEKTRDDDMECDDDVADTVCGPESFVTSYSSHFPSDASSVKTSEGQSAKAGLCPPHIVEGNDGGDDGDDAPTLSSGDRGIRDDGTRRGRSPGTSYSTSFLSADASSCQKSEDASIRTGPSECVKGPDDSTSISQVPVVSKAITSSLPNFAVKDKDDTSTVVSSTSDVDLNTTAEVVSLGPCGAFDPSQSSSIATDPTLAAREFADPELVTNRVQLSHSEQNKIVVGLPDGPTASEGRQRNKSLETSCVFDAIEAVAGIHTAEDGRAIENRAYVVSAAVVEQNEQPEPAMPICSSRGSSPPFSVVIDPMLASQKHLDDSERLANGAQIQVMESMTNTITKHHNISVPKDKASSPLDTRTSPDSPGTTSISAKSSRTCHRQCSKIGGVGLVDKKEAAGDGSLAPQENHLPGGNCSELESNETPTSKEHAETPAATERQLRSVYIHDKEDIVSAISCDLIDPDMDRHRSATDSRLPTKSSEVDPTIIGHRDRGPVVHRHDLASQTESSGGVGEDSTVIKMRLETDRLQVNCERREISEKMLRKRLYALGQKKKAAQELLALKSSSSEYSALKALVEKEEKATARVVKDALQPCRLEATVTTGALPSISHEDMEQGKKQKMGEDDAAASYECESFETDAVTDESGPSTSLTDISHPGTDACSHSPSLVLSDGYSSDSSFESNSCIGTNCMSLNSVGSHMCGESEASVDNGASPIQLTKILVPENDALNQDCSERNSKIVENRLRSAASDRWTEKLQEKTNQAVGEYPTDNTSSGYSEDCFSVSSSTGESEEFPRQAQTFCGALDLGESDDSAKHLSEKGNEPSSRSQGGLVSKSSKSDHGSNSKSIQGSHEELCGRQQMTTVCASREGVSINKRHSSSACASSGDAAASPCQNGTESEGAQGLNADIQNHSIRTLPQQPKFEGDRYDVTNEHRAPGSNEIERYTISSTSPEYDVLTVDCDVKDMVMSATSVWNEIAAVLH